MNTVQQSQILQKREVILAQITQGKGTLNERMQTSVKDVAELGKMMNKWIDDMAVQYRTSGMELEEWFDDIVEWMKDNQFMVEEIENLPIPNGNYKCILHCHLSNEGMGRHVVMKFTLLR